MTEPPLFPQLGLLVDLSLDGLMIPEDGVNDEELEAEFLALVGGQPQALEKLKGKGEILSTPLNIFWAPVWSWALRRGEYEDRGGPCPPGNLSLGKS